MTLNTKCRSKKINAQVWLSYMKKIVNMIRQGRRGEGGKQTKHLVLAFFLKTHTLASIIVALFYALYLAYVTLKQFSKGTFCCIICL